MKHILMAWFLTSALAPGLAAATQDLMTGDVVAGVAGGEYDVFDNDGNFILTLNDGLGGFTTGAFYDTVNNLLYTTNFSSSTVVVYDGLAPHTIVMTIPTAPFGGGSVESIVFDNSGNFYVGHATGDGDIKKFSSAGVFLDTFDVVSRSDWIDLAVDQKTMFYNDEGRTIRRYDVATDAQLADFAALPGSGNAFALRLLPPFDGSGGLIVADRGNIKRLDGAGVVSQTYDVAGQDNWFSMNLDPNGTSFWAGDFGTDNFYRFHIASGAVEEGPVNVGGGNTLFGLAVVGEITAAINCFTMGFETDDSGLAMVHGTKVDSEFDGGGVFPIVTGSLNGSGMNTAAILNSSTGPAAQDPDLLVDTGNILILQTDANTSECPPASGVYCSHNDDEDGGALTFDWGGRLISARSVVLIDIDASDGASSVVLTDDAGAQRTYTVPANWTGDLVTDATSGTGTLDLTMLAPQPGFGSIATASEDGGFDPLRVVRIDVHLGGSGGVDDVSWCTSGAGVLLASARPRNGSGVNPMILSNAGLPRLGRAWVANLDCRNFGSGTASLIIRARPTLGALSPFGEELISGLVLYRTSCAFSASVSQLSWDIPNDVSLMGLSVYAQGLCRGGTISVGGKLSGVGGRLSNALDLTLGF